MRVLVTGGTGFLGRAVTSKLLERGDTIGVLVRGGRQSPLQTTGLRLEGDRWTEQQLAQVIAEFAPDAILHLIGSRETTSLEMLYETNVFLAVRLIKAAEKAAPAARVLLVGSAAEYGYPVRSSGVCREDDPCRPVNAYGISKLAQTLHGLEKARAGRPVTIARVFNLVGADLPLGNAFADIARRLGSGAAEIRVGNTASSRDFLSSAEAARMLLSLLSHPDAAGKVINLCSGVAQPLQTGIDRLVTRCGRAPHFLRDESLIRAADVSSISGCTDALVDLGISPASSDIAPELDALMDKWWTKNIEQPKA